MGEKPTGIQRALRRAEQQWPDANKYVALAFHAGVSAQVVYKWEAIGGIPTTRHALKVCELTGVAVSDLAPAIDAKPAAAPPPERARRGQRGVRPFQKKAKALSIVQSVDRSEPAVGEMATVEGAGQSRVAMVERPPDVLEWLAAMEQHRREPVAQAVRGHGFLKTG